MKYWRAAVCIILCMCVFFTALDGIPAKAVTNESIQQKEKEIENAKAEVSSLKSNLTDVEALKKELEASKSSLTDYVTQLDSQLNNIQEKIQQYNTLITEKEAEIATTTEELNAAIEMQETQYEAMKMRIKFMYERGDTFYLELLLSPSSFADMANKAEYIEALSRYDRNKLDEYVQTKELIELCKEELEVEKEVLDEAKAAVELEEANVSALISEKTTQLTMVNMDIADKEAAIKEFEAMIAAENEEIAALEKAVAEEKARLAAENARVYNGGMFAWPCPGYKRISDEYGYRMHPILGREQFHNGLDMAAPSGTAILAAYDGDVVAASSNVSMGNYIMIDHGSGLYTIYMHASALYVSKGQTVYKGETIAAVGSSGRSTGPHLHFSVRLNGNYVSPWDYLK